MTKIIGKASRRSQLPNYFAQF